MNTTTENTTTENTALNFSDIQNTLELQNFSLQQFMGKFGYTLYRTNKGGYVFVSGMPGKIERRLMSMENAIRLHNSDWQVDETTGRCQSADGVYQTDLYTLIQAISSKIVNKIKFQYSKKKKQLILNSKVANIVKFEQKVYENIFLPA